MSDVRAQSRRPRRSARPETLIVTLNTPPRRDALLTLPDGGSAKVREVLIISGEKVILADRAATASAYLNWCVRQGVGGEWLRSLVWLAPWMPGLIWVRDLVRVGDVMVDGSVRVE